MIDQDRDGLIGEGDLAAIYQQIGESGPVILVPCVPCYPTFFKRLFFTFLSEPCMLFFHTMKICTKLWRVRAPISLPMSI